MNFEYSDDVRAMAQALARALDRACPMQEVRGCLEAGRTSMATWQALAELGVLGASVPEADGGAGLTLLEQAACAEVIGRACAPVPTLGSVYLATRAVVEGAGAALRAHWLGALVRGQAIGCAALHPQGLRIEEGGCCEGVISQAIGPVDAQLLVIVHGTGVWLVDLSQPGVRRRALPVLDPGLALTHIELDRVAAQPLQTDGEALVHRAAVCLAFEQLGGAERALEMARSYVLQRRTFGRTVGSYQAVKHKLADVWVKNQIARGHAYRAAWATTQAPSELALAATAARVACGEAFELAAQENLQLHGGLGFTWEADCHPLYKRARATSLVLGATIDWKQRLAALLPDCTGA